MRSLIKKLLKEELGVPKGIYETSLLIYDDILSLLKNEKLTKDQYNYSLSRTDNYQINEFEIKTIQLTINVSETIMVNDVEFYEGAINVTATSKMKKGIKVFEIVDNQGVSQLFFGFAAPTDWEIGDLISFFINNKEEMVRVLSHEFKHEYDNFMNKKINFYKRVTYDSAKLMFDFIPPLDKLSFYIYYMSKIESLVRPTEVSTSLKIKKIERKDFLNFLFDDNTYKTLKEIKDFSYEKLKSELKLMLNDTNYKNFVRDAVENNFNINVDNLSDDELVKELLIMYYVLLTDKKISIVISRYNFFESPPEWFFKLSRNFSKILNREKGFEEAPNIFFGKTIKNLNFEAEKMIKKISKLYAMIEEKKMNESIINPKIYGIVNNQKEEILKRMEEIFMKRDKNETKESKYGKSKPKKR